jgi:hypothetical protein
MGKGDTHQKKHNKRNKNDYVKRELILAQEDEFYAKIIKSLGFCKFTVQDLSGREYMATALRSFKKGPRTEKINIGDFVKIQKGVSQNQYYINHLYTSDDIDKLFAYNEINKPDTSTTVDNNDLDNDNIPQTELTDADIWDI